MLKTKQKKSNDDVFLLIGEAKRNVEWRIDWVSTNLPNILPKTLNSVTSNGEPQFERPKSTTQGDAPMLKNEFNREQRSIEDFNDERRRKGMKSSFKFDLFYSEIYGFLGVFMSKINWINRHGIDHSKFVTDPETREIPTSQQEINHSLFRTKNRNNQNSSEAICSDLCWKNRRTLIIEWNKNDKIRSFL